MICLDERPNMATLCCGNAMHFNCCAEWLSRSNKCPICRQEMPPISRQVIRALEEPEETWETGDDDSRLSDSIERTHPAILSQEYQNLVGRFSHGVRNNRRHTNHPIRRPIPFPRLMMSNSESDNNDDGDLFDLNSTSTSEEEDVRGSESAISNRLNNMESNSDETTTESPSINDSTVGEQDGEHDNSTTMLSEDISQTRTSDLMMTTAGRTGTTTIDDIDSSLQEQRRRNYPTICAASACRNRPAVDCVNSLCGRCCILIGIFHCPRHNS